MTAAQVIKRLNAAEEWWMDQPLLISMPIMFGICSGVVGVPVLLAVWIWGGSDPAPSCQRGYEAVQVESHEMRWVSHGKTGSMEPTLAMRWVCLPREGVR